MDWASRKELEPRTLLGEEWTGPGWGCITAASALGTVQSPGFLTQLPLTPRASRGSGLPAFLVLCP